MLEIPFYTARKEDTDVGDHVLDRIPPINMRERVGPLYRMAGLDSALLEEDLQEPVSPVRR
ncbi:hypothetical protein [Actinocorallia sp. A-T 12471]|uniref:hypothetical protein n=1 Tax=Actinocorallia sp. A-T 12471 TaxID=3089813 RepID=UPI0029D234E6|nr:hypothetical protein [Actinocorallia sp. A-T 12471]MDX6740453.1 hypothetical protein [Actinocorallia sp. A-T 12471]